jgi:hypothetical protein
LRINEEEAKQILDKCKLQLKSGKLTESDGSPLNSLHLAMMKLYVSLRIKLTLNINERTKRNTEALIIQTLKNLFAYLYSTEEIRGGVEEH